MLFDTAYLCETIFSALLAMKMKYRQKMDAEKARRIEISYILEILLTYMLIGAFIHPTIY